MTHDTEQAIDRIVHLISNEEDRKVVFLTGSGISRPVVASTEQLTDLFLEELGPSSGQVRTRISSYSISDKYQAAAQELKQRRGERSLSAAVKKAVLKALDEDRRDEIKDLEHISPNDWNLPPAQRLLGELAAKIPRQQLGAVITTNFDPLTEAAFERNDVRNATLATPGNQAFPIDSVYGVVPIVHLHGYWVSTATLSTSMHLNNERPQIERMISRLLDKAAVIVLGYAGWEDSFTRTLVRMLNEGYMSSLESEILWLQHSGPETIAGHSLLNKIQGEPGVNIYCGIDAEDLLTGVLRSLESLRREHRVTYPGWDIPPSAFKDPPRQILVSYFNGAHPTLDVSNFMPRLSNSAETLRHLNNLFENRNDAILLLSSSAGEGKTTALQQAAIDFYSVNPLATVLIRRPGAPSISLEWIKHIREENEMTILFIDDADLTLDEIFYVLNDEKNESNGRIIWVLATHTSYARSQFAVRLLTLRDSYVLDFDALNHSDALALSKLWTNLEMLPPSLNGKSPEKISDILLGESDRITQGASLFGSLLDHWQGDGLVGRVKELLDKLSNLAVSGVNFRYLLAAVAVTQHAWHSQQGPAEGLSLAAFGRLANVKYADVTKIIIRPLGKEVGLSQIGDKVFVRHQAIAKAIFEIFSDSKELDELCKDIARQGAALRFDQDYAEPDSHAAYRLPRRLHGGAALEAAKGAVEGANNYLEPRVTLLASLRENNRAEMAADYAKNLEDHLHEYDDYARTARGFYVEWSMVEAAQGHIETAALIALRSLSDSIDSNPKGKQIEYALGCVRNFARRLAYIKRSGAEDLANAADSLLQFLPSYLDKNGVRPDSSPSQKMVVVTAFLKASQAFAGNQTLHFKRLSDIFRLG